MVTPAAMSSSFLRSRRCAETSASSLRLLTPRISVGIVEDHCLDPEPALAIEADEVRQVVLPLRVLGADGA